MTDETTDFSTGRTEELERHGYKPIRFDANETAPPSEEIDIDTAVGRRRNDQPEERPILETKWSGDPEVAFEDAETATEALKASRARYHEETTAKDQAEKDDTLGKQIDQLRGEPSQPQLETAAQDAEAKAAAEREHLELMQRFASEHQAEEQTRALNARQTEIQARGTAVVAQLSADFPEISNLPLDKIAGVVAALESRDPARAQALVGRLKAVDVLYTQAEQVKAAKAQHESTHHANYVREQGEAFDRATAKDAPERRQAIFAGVKDLLQSSGIDPGAYADAARRGGELGRLLASNAVQSLLYTAAAARLDSKSSEAQRAELQKKLAKMNVPPVVRPGSGGQRPLAGAALTSKLNAKLAAGGEDALRAAAGILTARRAGR